MLRNARSSENALARDAVHKASAVEAIGVQSIVISSFALYLLVGDATRPIARACVAGEERGAMAPAS